MENWPAHTPKLNPIEKLWARLECIMTDMGPAHDVEALEVQVKTAWDSIPMNVINRFVMSFEDGLKFCRVHRGEI